MFAAWAGQGEPTDPKALALHRMNVLREFRGGLHGAAVVASGLEPLEALMVRSPGMVGLFGWPEPHPDPEPHQSQWAEAEKATNRMMGRAFGALSESERSELVELAVAAKDAAA
jgi:hypothetical protein